MSEQAARFVFLRKVWPTAHKPTCGVSIDPVNYDCSCGFTRLLTTIARQALNLEEEK